MAEEYWLVRTRQRLQCRDLVSGLLSCVEEGDSDKISLLWA